MPPQGGWQPQQPGGQPPYGGPPPGGGYPQHSGPQQPYSGQQPPGFPQGPWPQQPPGPPPKGNSTKWLLIAIAVLLVVGISIGATLLFTRDGGTDPSNPPASGTPSDIASANDTGPVTIITEEPTCDAFVRINNSLADLQAQGWSEQRDGLGAESTWTTTQGEQVRSVATAMGNASDQIVALIKQTPHRVIRELYEQTVVYGRAYADSVSNYTPADNFLADVFVNASSAVTGMCNAIAHGSVDRSLAVPAAPAPTKLATMGDPSNPSRFIGDSDRSECREWIEREQRFISDGSEWAKLDADIPGSQWTPEQKAVQQATYPIFTAYADDIEAAGRRSGNPTLEDFATSAALYIRAYVSAGDAYASADSWLYYAAFRLSNTITGACQAAGG